MITSSELDPNHSTFLNIQESLTGRTPNPGSLASLSPQKKPPASPYEEEMAQKKQALSSLIQECNTHHKDIRAKLSKFNDKLSKARIK